MKASLPLYIFAALCVLFLLGGIGLWKFDASCSQELEQAKRQYGDTRALIAQYENMRTRASPRKKEPTEGLFAEINRIGTDLRLIRRIETLRPSGESAGKESLDVQIRGLYLAEFLRFLQRVENLDNVAVERMTLTRPASRLLDVEMRLIRQEAQS